MKNTLLCSFVFASLCLGCSQSEPDPKSREASTKSIKVIDPELQKWVVALAQTDLSNREELIGWVRNGLRYFHQLSYIDSLKVKVEMITEVNNGFTVVLNGQSYWLPKNQ